jgi:epoxyqueuosine reductase QueG
MMTNNEENIKTFLNNEGILLTGIASVQHLPGIPKEFTPSTILTDAQSVIVYAVPIPRGIVYADAYDTALYWRYCNMTYRYLDVVSCNLSIFLEDKGHTATPAYGCFPWKVVNREFWGLIPLVYWAEQAGLGTVTKCGLLVNPVYGTRILLGGVITTMNLVPSKRLNNKICPPDCFECVKACPVHAIKASGKVDHNQCIRHASENPLLHHLLKESTEYTFETLINTLGIDDHGTYICLDCVKACPLNKVI